ncbi:unnamed protein product [marine sediment metagenome]|uniref:Uncharacterized protein n=1 Tax=marine sediment metagenome TaxID=412755 RepID=X0YDF0_9ZZZZ
MLFSAPFFASAETVAMRRAAAFAARAFVSTSDAVVVMVVAPDGAALTPKPLSRQRERGSS